MFMIQLEFKITVWIQERIMVKMLFIVTVSQKNVYYLFYKLMICKCMDCTYTVLTTSVVATKNTSPPIHLNRFSVFRLQQCGVLGLLVGVGDTTKFRSDSRGARIEGISFTFRCLNTCKLSPVVCRHSLPRCSPWPLF